MNLFDSTGSFSCAAGAAARVIFGIVDANQAPSDLTGRTLVWRFLDWRNEAVGATIAGTVAGTTASFDFSGAATEALRDLRVAYCEIAMLTATGRVVLHRGAATIDDGAPFLIGVAGAPAIDSLTALAGAGTLIISAQGAPGSSTEAIAAAALANTAAGTAQAKATLADTAAAIASTAAADSVAKTALAVIATTNAVAATTAATAATADSVAKTALTVTATNAATAGATAANTAAAQIVPEGGPSLLIKPGTGTFPAIADSYFTGSKSLYSNFDGLRRQLRGFADVLDITRATTGTYFDAAGILQTAPSGAARLGYRFNTASLTWVLAGLLIEAQATNVIINSGNTGAVVGSPGTAPTNWTITTGANNGISREVVATGISNGVSYTDIRFFGTATANSSNQITFGRASTSAGQTWTGSSFAALVAGTNPGSNLIEAIFESDGTTQTYQTRSVGLTSQFLRRAYSRVLTGANPTQFQYYYQFNVVSGGTYDFTLRLGGIQTELGPVATSHIPTTTAQVTRAGDVFTKALGIEFNSAAQTALFMAITPADGTGDLSYWVWSNGTDNLRFFYRAATKMFFLLLTLNGTQSAINGPTVTADTAYKVAIGFSGKQIRLVVNGTAYADNSSNTGVATGSFTTRRIGVGSATTTQPNAFILPYLPHPTNPLLDATEFPRLLTVAEMQAYTA